MLLASKGKESMSQDTLLSLEARLLVARYGRRRVLETLAEISSVDLAVIQREIEAYEVKGKNRKPTRRRSSVGELLKKANLNEDTRPLVEKIVYAYDNKEFLPQLQKVKRFLESQGISSDQLRSRADALPKVIDVLAHQSSESLEKLAVESETNDKGDLGLIADQILGPCAYPNDTRMSRIAQPEPLQYTESKRKEDSSTGDD